MKTKGFIITLLTATGLLFSPISMAKSVPISKSMMICESSSYSLKKRNKQKSVKTNKEKKCDYENVTFVFEVNDKFANRNLVRSLLDSYTDQVLIKTKHIDSPYSRLKQIRGNMRSLLQNADNSFNGQLFNSHYVRILF